jgi:hypothetical protein
MAKKEFNIQTLINLQKTVETMISTTSSSIRANNPYKKNTGTELVDTNKLYDKLERLYIQLNSIKACISKANGKKTSLGVSNQDLIYELSNLKRHQTLLEQLIESKRYRRDGAKENAWEFQIDKSVLHERLLDIEERISDIKDAMTEFNASNTVKLIIDDTLDLI